MRIFLLVLLAALMFVSVSGSQTILPEPGLHALVLRGIDLTWEQKYSEADSVFRLVIREFPDHPAGYVYRAGVMQSEAIDFEMQLDVPRFDSLIALGEEKARALIERADDAKWGNFFLGTAEGYDSYARVYRGDWVGGTMKGFSSVSDFKKAVTMDSMMFDAYAGIGAFDYWRSRKTEYFNWLPFVGDDRPEAFTFLQKTVKFGLYNRYTALSMLITIYTDAEAYEKAVEYSRLALQHYPTNRMFLWGLATALQKSGKLHETAVAYNDLLRSLVNGGDGNLYNQIVCRLNLAKIDIELKDSVHARENLSAILGFRETDFAPHLRERAKDKLKQASLLSRGIGDGRTSNR